MNDEINLGGHKFSERTEYVERKTKEYLGRHPEATYRVAHKKAKLKWARKIKTEAQSKKHVNRIRIVK